MLEYSKSNHHCELEFGVGVFFISLTVHFNILKGEGSSQIGIDEQMPVIGRRHISLS